MIVRNCACPSMKHKPATWEEVSFSSDNEEALKQIVERASELAPGKCGFWYAWSSPKWWMKIWFEPGSEEAGREIASRALLCFDRVDHTYS